MPRHRYGAAIDNQKVLRPPLPLGALKDSPPPEWLPDIDQAWFRGSFAMGEIVFLHRSSATAIVADLIQTFSDCFLREYWGWWRFLARLDGLTQDQARAPLEWRLSFINRAAARRARDGTELALSANGRRNSLPRPVDRRSQPNSDGLSSLVAAWRRKR